VSGLQQPRREWCAEYCWRAARDRRKRFGLPQATNRARSYFASVEETGKDEAMLRSFDFAYLVLALDCNPANLDSCGPGADLARTATGRSVWAPSMYQDWSICGCSFNVEISEPMPWATIPHGLVSLRATGSRVKCRSGGRRMEGGGCSTGNGRVINFFFSREVRIWA
jgi:hypothetical protein